MPASISKPALNLREIIARVAGLERRIPPIQKPFDFSSFVGGETEFKVEEGWKVKQVFRDGYLLRKGEGSDYTVSNDGFRDIITFSVSFVSSEWLHLVLEKN